MVGIKLMRIHITAFHAWSLSIKVKAARFQVAQVDKDEEGEAAQVTGSQVKHGRVFLVHF